MLMDAFMFIAGVAMVVASGPLFGMRDHIVPFKGGYASTAAGISPRASD